MRQATGRLRSLAGAVLAALWALCGVCAGAPQVELDGAIFFEAEDYDRLLWGEEGFGTRTDEGLGSGEKVLIGMYRPGAVAFNLTASAAGDYMVWMRCAAPSNTTVKLGANVVGEDELRTARVEITQADLTAPGAYQWRNLGPVTLRKGANSFVLGQGAQRPDCFLITPRAEESVDDGLLARVRQIREAPKGELLPELTHDRQITRRPAWLRETWRASYAHFEWDRDKASPEEWCRRAKEAGATAIVGAGEMPAGSVDGKMKAFPFSSIDRAGFTLPENYSLDYSWTREFVEAAHSNGLKMVLYDGAHRTLDPILLEHPQWRQLEADGRVYRDGFGSWHSPYRQAYIDRWVKVAQVSGMDGIMIDMLFTGPQNGDFSQYTVDAFRERFGVEPPREPDPRNLTWQRWIDFQTWTREEVLLELTEALHSVNPEIAVIVNQTAGWIFHGTSSNFLGTRAGRYCDGLLEEMGWEFKHNWNRPWAWPLHAQWQNLFLHCRTRPGWGHMWAISHNFPAAHNLSLNYAMFANGTAPGVVTGGNWPEMTEVWGHIAACEPATAGAELTPWLALHFGEDTLNWYANAAGNVKDNPRYQAWLMNLFGLFQAALELHLPVEIITDDALAAPEVLERYAAVLLPGSACLSQTQADALTGYVAQGGGVVATGHTGCFDENGTRLERPRLAGLFGAVQQPAVASSQWSLPLGGLNHPAVGHPEIRGSGAWSQGQSNPAASGVLYSGSRSIAATPLTGIEAGTFSALMQGGPQTEGQYRALLCREVGQGKAALFPLEIGHAYSVWNHPLNRRLIGQAVEWAAARPCPLRTNAPMIAQTVLWEREAGPVVHLLNDISSFGRAAAPNPEAYTAFRAEVIPLHDLTVSVPGEFSRARLLPGGDALEATREDGWSTVQVPRLEVHAVVAFER